MCSLKEIVLQLVMQMAFTCAVTVLQRATFNSPSLINSHQFSIEAITAILICSITKNFLLISSPVLPVLYAIISQLISF